MLLTQQPFSQASWAGTPVKLSKPSFRSSCRGTATTGASRAVTPLPCHAAGLDRPPACLGPSLHCRRPGGEQGGHLSHGAQQRCVGHQHVVLQPHAAQYGGHLNVLSARGVAVRGGGEGVNTKPRG